MSKKKSKKAQKETTQESPVSTPAPRRSFKHLKRIGLAAFILLLLLGGLFAFAMFMPESLLVKRVSLPQVEGSPSQTVQEAREGLEIAAERFLGADITLQTELGELSTTLKDLGFTTDANEVALRLERFEATAHPLEKFKVLLFGMELKNTLLIDEPGLHTKLAAAGLERLAINPHYSLNNAVLEIMPGTLGNEVNLEEMIKTLQGEWLNPGITPASLALALEDVQPLSSEADLELAKPKVEKLLGHTIDLRDEFGMLWIFNVSEQVHLLLPHEDTLILDPEGFALYAKTLDEAIYKEAQPAKIVQVGEEYEFRGSARFGYDLNEAAFKTALEEKLKTALEGAENFDDLLWLPIDRKAPAVKVPDSLKEQGVTDLVGVGYTTFYGSPVNRLHNIGVGMEKFNGTWLKPGEEFSFTKLMGPITPEHGWKAELVIKGDETIPEFGGGLCQVSSTMYRAALFSGLPITARSNHSYAVTYYSQVGGHGLDATIYDPSPDLRFINDTDAPLLIQGYRSGYEVYFVFYGKNDGRRAFMEGPYTYGHHSAAGTDVKYTDELAPGERVLDSYAHTGFKADWYRIIRRADGTEGERENIHSDYEARPAKYLEGRPADAPIEGAATEDPEEFLE